MRSTRKGNVATSRRCGLGGVAPPGRSGRPHEHHPVVARVLEGEVEVLEVGADQPLARRGRAKRALQIAEEGCVPLIDDGAGQRLAAVEVPVGRHRRELDAGGDRPHRERLRAALDEEVARGGEDAVPGRSALLHVYGAYSRSRALSITITRGQALSRGTGQIGCLCLSDQLKCPPLLVEPPTRWR